MRVQMLVAVDAAQAVQVNRAGSFSFQTRLFKNKVYGRVFSL